MLNCDIDSGIEDEFFTALALLKSTHEESELELRKMLLDCIERKAGIPSCEKVLVRII